MKKTLVAGIGACAVALAFAAKDPVIMTVNGVDVPKSEFEYLYNKNSQQQINPQNLDEYVNMFTLYKMKVADAKAEGIDTTAAFLKEIAQYRHDLAAPYLADSVYINSLVKEAYDRSKEEVQAQHIMLFKQRNPALNKAMRQRIDSIHGLLEKGANFEELVGQYSQDRGSNGKGGMMGFIQANVFPYEFETQAWTLKPGEFSKVIETPAGYHILKGGLHRPARGKVQAAHILVLTQGKDEAGQAAAKAKADSLYQVVVANPDSFSDVATKNSEDRGSARQGGMLPLFGAGEMVAEFDSTAFALKDGEISRPVQSRFGWHIIKKIKSEPIESLDKIKPSLLTRFQNPQDARSRMIRDHQTAAFAKKHKAAIDSKNFSLLRDYVAKNGITEKTVSTWTNYPNSMLIFAQIDGKGVGMDEFVKSFGGYLQADPESSLQFLDDMAQEFFNRSLLNAEELSLEKTVPEYANLLKEYVDGSLLYEVSVRKVWDRAAQDTEGLEKYFRAHRDQYAWKEPHAKGYLVQAANDSVAELVRARAAELGRDTLINTIRKEFPHKARVDKVLVPKGANPMVDNLVFGGPKTNPESANYTVYFMLEPRVISIPEEVADVKGLVTSDYQNEFQEAWEKELRKKYPVTVNRKVLKTVKTVAPGKKQKKK